MRPPTRIPSQQSSAAGGYAPRLSETLEVPRVRPPAPRNPYEDLAALAEPEEDYADYADDAGYGHSDDDDPLGLGLREDDDEAGDEWAPPDHRRSRRRRGRFAALPVAAKAVVAVLVAAAFLTVADRWAVLYAEQRAQEKLKDSLHLAAEPEVTIHGFPFLTQMADKRLGRVDVAIPDVAADRVSLAKVEATAEDIRLSGSLPASIRGALIGRMRGDVLLSFDDLNRELGSSQVKFTDMGHNSVLAVGKLPVAGHELRMRAEAHIRRVGGRGIETDIAGMRLDVADVATYRPGKRAGLQLTRKAAERVRRDMAQAKALLSVPSLAQRLGVPPSVLEETLRSDERLHEVTGAPRFVEKVMGLNLVDVVAEHPWLLKKVGIDPALVAGLMKLTQPQLSERLSLAFELPDVPGYVRLRDISVEEDGIRVDLSGMDLPFGDR
ncbi:LmeA family phospholipid-binding protein [Streptomyces sp. 8N616]|uniref:LmeA family phospholipid-binding protein n=1 Tax=Streptomyces sp. 8N616 TaxID=3457414 RepID=UPI003FD6BD85